jgi:hypothetical protein
MCSVWVGALVCGWAWGGGRQMQAMQAVHAPIANAAATEARHNKFYQQAASC